MSQPPEPPHSGPPYPEQPYSGQPNQGQPSSGQPYEGGLPSGQPYPGQPNPDVPTSVPPQPGYPPQYGQPQYGQPQYGQPQYGQPEYGQQPQYGQPEYVQEPGYGQLGYGQPQFGQQPEYGQPGYGVMGAPQPPKKKSKAVPIILVSIAVLLVLCVGGAAVIFLVARDKAGDIVDAAESAAGTPTTTAPTAAPTTDAPAPKTITIVEPKTLGGRPKLTDPQFADVAKELQSGLADVPGATNTVGALYGTPAKQDIIVIAGVEAPIDNPTQELNGTFLGAGVGGLKVTGISTVDPGPLGGVAKCGKADASGVDMVLCGWADDGSVGWIIWYFKSVSKAKAEFAKLRGQIEKSS
jgi:hypothetical protein